MSCAFAANVRFQKYSCLYTAAFAVVLAFCVSIFLPAYSPNSLLLGFPLLKKGLAALAGRALNSVSRLCVGSCPPLVLLLSCRCPLAALANPVSSSCPVVLWPLSSSCPSFFCPLLSSCPPAVVLFTLLCEAGNNNSYRLTVTNPVCGLCLYHVLYTMFFLLLIFSLCFFYCVFWLFCFFAFFTAFFVLCFCLRCSFA